MEGREANLALAQPIGGCHGALHSAALAVALLVGLASGCALAASSIDEEVRLRGTGPYRGRVVDATTKRPIADAVVVAVWYYSSPTVAGDLTHFHDAIEVLTDAEGHFNVDAPTIERRAPRSTSFPDFIVFKPGYLYFKGWFTSPEAMAERRNRALLGVVELAPIAGKGRKARLENLGAIPGDVPDEKIPEFMKAYREETRAIDQEKR
jgi:hypothetical protein